MIGVGSIPSFLPALGDLVTWLRVSSFPSPLYIEALTEMTMQYCWNSAAAPRMCVLCVVGTPHDGKLGGK